MRRCFVFLLLLLAVPAAGRTQSALELDQLVRQVRAEGVRYLFVGERHDVGAVKRFAVDLANALADAGADVGLYVEGFRTNCQFGDADCWCLARLFDGDAFGELLSRARVPVHAIDPPQRDDRVARMAAVVAAGSEQVRVVLVGRTHVVDAGNERAVLRVFGGGMRYPDPGDLAERFPASERLTIGLEAAPSASAPYRLLRDGGSFDFRLETPAGRGYWAGGPELSPYGRAGG